MRYLTPFIIGIIVSIVVSSTIVSAAVSVLTPSQGGTGIGSTTVANVGNCLKVLDDSPFRYELGSCGTGGGSGTVTSVAMTVPTGLTVTGSPVTTSSTLAIDLDTGYVIPTTTRALAWDLKAPTDSATFTGTTTLAGAYFSGNVGIGTTTPSRNLAVGGNVIIGASAGGGTNGTLTYGGVTLTNAVTGTGAMVLGTSPTFTTGATSPVFTSSVTTASGFVATSLTTGNAINVTPTTSGKGLNFNATGAGLTTGSALTVSGSGTMTADYTGAFIDVVPTRTMTAAATRNHSGNMLNINPTYSITGSAASIYNLTGSTTNISRTLTNSSTASTSRLAVTGPLMSLVNRRGTATNSINDSSSILAISQEYTSASGTVLSVNNLGVGPLATFVGNGNVGIGTSSPSGLLSVHVNGGRYFSIDSANARTVIQANDNSLSPAFILRNTLAGAGNGVSLPFQLGYGGTSGVGGTAVQGGRIAVVADGIWDATASTQDSYMQFMTTLDGAVGEVMRLSSSADVGIGTTTPDTRLTINDSAATLLKLQRNGGTDANTGLVFDGLTTDFHMGYNGTNFAIDTDNALSSGALFVLTPGGNVGIGTTSPGDTLSVAGTGLFSGLVRVARLAITGLSSAFTPSAEGEIGIDTTDNQIKYLANGTTSILSPYVEQAFIYASSSQGAGTTTLKLAGFPSATTFGLLGCTSHGTGTFVAVLGNGTASATPVLSTPTGSSTVFTTLTSNNSFPSGSSTVWAIGSVSGQVINPTCSFRRLINGT